MSVASVAAAQARYLCDVADIGYSQPDRRTWYTNADEAGYVTTPQNADCSSLVCGALSYGLHSAYGVPWGHQALLEINDFWTGNMRGGLEARGFPEVAWADADLTPAGGFRVGDVILSAANEGGTGHTVMVVEDGYDPLVSEAWLAEDGSIDGYAGDSTGGETRTVRYSGHPITAAGRWTSCHRFDDATFLSQWPEFAPGSAPAPAAPAPAAPAASGEPTHAHGVDVSSYQTGIDFGVVPADFVIVKVTQGCWYTNPAWRDQVASAVANGRRLGLYHFVDDDASAVAQAEFFLAAAADYLGRATLWLDWEGDGVSLGPGAAQAWLDTVAARTGTTPGFYTYQNVVRSYDWSGVAARYPLWIAGGPDYSDYGSGYSDPAVPDVPYWGSNALVHQYTEDGRLPGWGGSIDLNRLRDRAAWDAMIGATAPTDTTTTEEDDDMKLLGLDFGDGTHGYALLTPGLGAFGLTQTQADAYYRAGVRTAWVSAGDFNALVAQSWAHYNACFGNFVVRKDIEAATAEVLAEVRKHSATKTGEAAA